MNENLLATNEVVETVEDTAVVEETVIQDDASKVEGNSVDTDTTSADTTALEGVVQDISNNLNSEFSYISNCLFLTNFFLLTILLFLFLHFMTERRKV